MKTSESGRKFIESFEGLVLKASDDGFGTPTVGYGHTSAAGPPTVHNGMVITAEQADEYLTNDLAKVEQEIDLLVRVPLNQNQFDALVSFEFNTGALRASSVLQFLNQGNYQEAAGRMLLYNHAGGRVVPGLTRRRQAEYKMFLSNATPQHPIPSVPSVSIWTTIFNYIINLLFTRRT